MDTKFQWTNFYMELASALLAYKNNRSELINILKTIYADAGKNFPFKEKGEIYDDICPFTIFGSFNKGITNDNRIALLEQFAKQFTISRFSLLTKSSENSRLSAVTSSMRAPTLWLNVLKVVNPRRA